VPRRFRVEVSAAAEADVAEIFTYLEGESRLVAVRWIRGWDAHVRTLETFPLRCPRLSHPRRLARQYRTLLYGAYRCVFRVNDGLVTVVRVIHGARLLRRKDLVQ
jgi:plasmid stabilization system protein ParE